MQFEIYELILKSLTIFLGNLISNYISINKQGISSTSIPFYWVVYWIHKNLIYRLSIEFGIKLIKLNIALIRDLTRSP